MSWYDTPGKDHDVVICTRARLARNIEGLPFTPRMDAPMAEELLQRLDPLLTTGGFMRADFQQISHTALCAMVEKQYVSPAFMKVTLPHGLYLNEPCHLSVSVCEEDHLRLRCVLPGCTPSEALEGVRRVEEMLDETLDYAFDPQGLLGYLSPCPANLGCALRISALLFLPCLTQGGRMEAVSARLTQGGMMLRGIRGAGCTAGGYLYEISNRSSLGCSEETLAHSLHRAIVTLIEEERHCRCGIKGETLDRLSDRVWRALGILKFARALPLGEFVELLADVRLGAAMGILPGGGIRDLTAILIEALPAGLSITSGLSHPSDRELDVARGVLTREKLKGYPSDGAAS